MRKLIVSTTVAASLIGVGAGALIAGPGIAGAGPGIAGAQVSTEAPETETETEDQAKASSLGDVLAPLVEDGTITESQAVAVTEAIEAARAEHDQFRGGRFGFRGFGKSDVLSDLGIDAEALREGRSEGLTLGEIAEANGSSIDALTDALTTQVTEQLGAAVEAGRLSDERAAEIEASVPERVEALINGEAHAERGGRGRGHHGPRGHKGQMNDSAD